MTKTSGLGSDRGSVAVATAVPEVSLVVTDELIEKAKAAADAELSRRKQVFKESHDKSLQELRARLENEAKSVQRVLDETERSEKAIREAAERNARLTQDAVHRASIFSLESQEQAERARFEERFQDLKRRENFIHEAWAAANPQWASLLNEREGKQLQHAEEKQELERQWKIRTQELQQELKQVRREWEKECNGANQKHSSHLMYGLLLGCLVGFLFDRARF